MSDCEYRSRLDAFFDGELDPPDTERIERHVESCADCAAELREMRQVGRMFDALADEPMSDAALSRVHQAVDRTELDSDGPLSIWRVALVLTALAASVVVIGSVWMREVPGSGTRPPAVYVRGSSPAAAWEQIATSLDPTPLPQTQWDSGDRTRLADTRLTQFMVENLKRRAPHESQ